MLFPADPIKNAAHILSTFDRAFPSRRGSYLFGPAVQISLGHAAGPDDEPRRRSSSSATARASSSSDGVAAVMPSEQHDLLRLHMSAIGVIDFDQGSISLDAVLYDSRLAGKFPVTGSMAMRVSWGGERVFALVDRRIPPGVQAAAAFPALERLAITLQQQQRLPPARRAVLRDHRRTPCRSARRSSCTPAPAGSPSPDCSVTTSSSSSTRSSSSPASTPRCNSRTTRRTSSRCPSKASCPAHARCTSGARRRSRSSGATSRCASTRR